MMLPHKSVLLYSFGGVKSKTIILNLIIITNEDPTIENNITMLTILFTRFATACDCDLVGTLAGGPCARDGGQCRVSLHPGESSQSDF